MTQPEAATRRDADPNVVLSDIIVGALGKEELLVETRLRGAAQKIAAGTAVPTDWGTWAREAIKRKETPDATQAAD